MLRITFPDESRIMKHYRNFLLKVFRIKPELLENAAALKSLTRHLQHCSSNPNTEITIIYLLGRLQYKNNKKNVECFEKILPKLKHMLFKFLDHPSKKLILDLMAKILKMNVQAPSVFSIKEIGSFLQNQITKVSNLEELGSFIPQILQRLSEA